jgi:hypothetical protein
VVRAVHEAAGPAVAPGAEVRVADPTGDQVEVRAEVLIEATDSAADAHSAAGMHPPA